MRLFETKSIWDAEFQKWQEVYFINNEHVEDEVFFKEMETEERMVVDECCCECDDKEGFSDEDIAIIGLIEDYADEVEDSDYDCCTLRGILMDAFLTGRSIGNEEVKDEMREFLG